MRIAVEEIPEEGLEVDFGPGDPWALEAAHRALEGEVLHVAGHLEVRRVGPGVQVSGRAAAAVAQTCVRCLRDVRVEVEGSVSLWYEHLPERTSDHATLSADALDVGFLDGGELDLGLALMEYLALEGPVIVRCGEARVTAPEDGPCELERRPEEPAADARFAVLRDLELDD